MAWEIKKFPGKVGAPTMYNEEIAKEICMTIATTNKSLNTLCKENKHWPSSSAIYVWRIEHPEFGEMFRTAKRHQIEAIVEEILDISDNESNDTKIDEEGKNVGNSVAVNRARLKVDTRKWLAAKLAPKLYGDKVQQEITVTSHEDALKKLDEL